MNRVNAVIINNKNHSVCFFDKYLLNSIAIQTNVLTLATENAFSEIILIMLMQIIVY